MILLEALKQVLEEVEDDPLNRRGQYSHSTENSLSSGSLPFRKNYGSVFKCSVARLKR